MAKKRKDRFGLSGEVHFQMAPLIDVVFLLLIFFICVTNFDKAENVDLLLAYAKSAKEYQKGKGTMVVNVTKNGQMVVLGQTGRVVFVHRGPLQQYMQHLVDEFGPNFRVAIRADRDAKMKQVKDVYRAAARVGLTRITLVTQTRKPAEGPVGTAVAPEDKLPEEEVIN
jgi:biopolymer transport protein ExbD